MPDLRQRLFNSAFRVIHHPREGGNTILTPPHGLSWEVSDSMQPSSKLDRKASPLLALVLPLWVRSTKMPSVLQPVGPELTRQCEQEEDGSASHRPQRLAAYWSPRISRGSSLLMPSSFRNLLSPLLHSAPQTQSGAHGGISEERRSQQLSEGA